MVTIEKYFERICAGANVLATGSLILVMFLLVAEVVGRYVFNHPIPGSMELAQMSMVVLATVGFAFSLQQGRHIKVTLMLDRYPARFRTFLINLGYFTGFAVCALLDWKLLASANRSLGMLEYTSGPVAVPIYPFKFVLVFSVLLVTIQFLLYFVIGMIGVKSKKVDAVPETKKLITVPD